MARGPDPLSSAGRRRPPALNDPKALDAALRAAVAQLDAATAEQERAANRILGLTELLIARAPDDRTRLRIEAIMEACAFQDITGQRLRKVRALLSRLTALPPGSVQVADRPRDPPPRAETTAPAAAQDQAGLADEGISTGRSGLSQEEVDRLLGRR